VVRNGEYQDQKQDKNTADQDFLIKAPTLSMPRGGGAIRGIGEKFAANPVTGSCTFSIPLPMSAGRAGFAPEVALTYDSGSGNGPFGFGWSLALPAITRKTDKGLPRYDDATDTFLISGAEDLVPLLSPAGTIDDDTHSVQGYAIRRYRPRVEGPFARIERWTRGDGDTHWRSISSDNVLNIYGKDGTCRIADPADPLRIFSWLICETRDDKGNAMVYDYKAEDGADLDLTQAHERGRGAPDERLRAANRYVDRIRYANAATLLDPVTLRRPRFLSQAAIDGTRWMFEIVFDYGTPDATNPDTVAPWRRRSDPFSTYRSGFEIRTYRLCRRVLLFHSFPADPAVGSRRLVRSLDLSYRTVPQHSASSDPGYTFLQAATQWAYQRHAGTWHRRALPPIELRYSEAVIGDLHDVSGQRLENLPVGLGSDYQWVDLDGDGVAGVLTEQAGAWYFKPALGQGPQGPEFGAMRPVDPRPSTALLAAGRQQLLDVQGDGAIELVNFRPPLAGYFQRDDDTWKPFVPFTSLPNIDWDDPGLRFIDLTGDGHADALITEHDVFTWYPSLAEKGFGAAERQVTSFDERHGPRVVFADGEDAIYLADMSGDGLADLVRIRNGETCYWPNLGYGRFGGQIVMDDSPFFDRPDQFDQRRLRLADIDGSGTTDLIYLGRDGARVWANRSGNAWSAPRHLPFPNATSHVGRVQVVDLLGNGTSCLVWSSDLPGDSGRQLRYLELMGGHKPHLLIEMRNNLGAVTTVEYAPSTKFYLRDKAAGTPWATRLPFPVHCVEKVTVTDEISKTVFTNAYSYHHGYFDGVEREFRGFGRVEQIDTQRFDDVSAANRDSLYMAADHKLYQPPVKTITWFHTGIAVERSRILALYEREYFPARYASQLSANGFAERVLPQPEVEASGPALDSDEWREAMRACKGMTLRQEVIELDVSALQDRGVHQPVRLFTATQNTCHVRRVQRRGRNQYAVFLVAVSESVIYQYELPLDTAALDPDPRVAHTLNLRFDAYGRVQQSVSAMYPRGAQHDDAALNAEQLSLIHAIQNRERHLSYAESRFTTELAPDVDVHRLPAVCETLTYELTGIDVPPTERYFSRAALREYQFNAVLDPHAAKIVATLEYHQQPPDQMPRMRSIEHVATTYFNDDLSGALALGTQGRLGLTCESYRLALTPELLDAVFARTAPQDDFPAEARTALALPGALPGFFAAGYQIGSAIPGAGAARASSWWLRSGVAGFETDAAAHFYLPERFFDSFGNETTVTYDADDLFITSSRDAAGNTSSVEAFDHRVLAPVRMKDPNDNVSEAAFDIHGLLVAAAAMGKIVDDMPETGNTVAGLAFEEINIDPADVADFFDTVPLNEGRARSWLGKASSRLVYHFGERYTLGVADWGVTAAGACSITRERHERDLANTPANEIPVQVAFEYSDGGGRIFVRKLQAEPDPPAPDGPSRWLASGKTVVNNKGKPVLQFEPYFSPGGHRFDEPIAVGVSPAMFYDALGRLVRTEFPDGTLNRVEFSHWLSRSFDQNDTVKESRWYRVRLTEAERGPDAVAAGPGEDAQAQQASPGDKQAARLAARHAGTPSEVHFDSLGRSVITILHNAVPSEDPALTNTPLPDRPWLADRILTFTKLDAEGKPLWICDARGNLVMQYISPPKSDHTPLYDEVNPDAAPAYDMPATAVPGYDLAGNVLFQRSMDTGDRRMLSDAAGQALVVWDYNERMDATTATVFREHRRIETRSDPLRRPRTRHLRVRDGNTGAVAEYRTEEFRYGEGVAADKANNRRGQLWQHYDGAGVVQIDAVDLSGKPLTVRTRLAAAVEAPVIDWTGRALSDVHVLTAAGFDREVFTQKTDYDAMGRVTRRYNWHVESPVNSGASPRVTVSLPHYGRRGMLEGQTLLVRARKTPTGHQEDLGVTRRQQAIAGITYDAKGQALAFELGNGTTTRYVYDPATFRLAHVFTKRGAAFTSDCDSGTADDELPARPCGVQNLHYRYDPVGNVTHVQDDAQQTIWFANQQVEPSCGYIYDATYRLIEGTGRENSAELAAPPKPEGPWPSDPFPSAPITRRYTQRYRYDRVGNIEELRHLAPATAPAEPPGWTQNYRYATDSNRLLETWFGRTRDPALGQGNVLFDHDAHGSLLNLGAAVRRFDQRWTWTDMIHTMDLGGGGRAWYQYGADKRRCRKRIERNPAVNGTFREERIYLDGYEWYRRYTGDPQDPVEEIESHHLFVGDQRVLLVDDVLKARNPRPDGVRVSAQTLWRYQYSNHLGSVSAELDDDARIISYEEFHPYGTSAYRLLESGKEAPAKRYRYTGMERDEESGLSAHGARSYAAWLGRWVSSDPEGISDGVNLYAYARANPAGFADATGKAARDKPTITTVNFEETEIKGKVKFSREAAAKLNREFAKKGDTEAAKFYYARLIDTQTAESNRSMKGVFVVWAMMGIAIASGVTGGLAGELALGGLEGVTGAKFLAAGFGGYVGGVAEVGAEQTFRAGLGERLLTDEEIALRVAMSTALPVVGEGVSLGVSRLKNALKTEPPPNVDLTGAAQSPRVRTNPDAVPRNEPYKPEDALKLLNSQGVDSSNMTLRVVGRGSRDEMFIPPNAEAAYGTYLAKRPINTQVKESELFAVEDTAVVFVRARVLQSREDILQTLSHEAYELNALRGLFARSKGAMTTGDYLRLIQPEIPGNLHDKAWAFSDAILRMSRQR
jgi:RHS repeat-associated protein